MEKFYQWGQISLLTQSTTGEILTKAYLLDEGIAAKKKLARMPL